MPAMYDNGAQYKYNVESGSFEDNYGKKYTGNNDFINTVTDCLHDLCSGEAGKTLVNNLVINEEGVAILSGEMNDGASAETGRFSTKEGAIKSIIYFNPEQEVQGEKEVYFHTRQ